MLARGVLFVRCMADLNGVVEIDSGIQRQFAHGRGIDPHELRFVAVLAAERKRVPRKDDLLAASTAFDDAVGRNGWHFDSCRTAECDGDELNVSPASREEVDSRAACVANRRNRLL